VSTSTRSTPAMTPPSTRCWRAPSSHTRLRGYGVGTATKKYYADLRNSFSELHFQVHENIGALVENDLVALRTIVTGDYAGVPATGRQIQTSVSHAKAVDARSDNCNRCPRRRSHRPRPPKTVSGAELTTIALPGRHDSGHRRARSAQSPRDDGTAQHRELRNAAGVVLSAQLAREAL
jgi:hypothetical protein